MYQSFAETGGDLGRATVFVLDEFGLPAGSPGRCDQMIKQDLLGLLDTQPALVDKIDIEATDLDEELKRYEEALRDGGLDLTILGLGQNGHLGLNEPGSSLDSVTRVVQLAAETGAHSLIYGSDRPATWGVTPGIDTLLASSELWLLVTGAHKAEILVRTMTADIGPEVPATFLRTHENVTVFADEDAAGLL